MSTTMFLRWERESLRAIDEDASVVLCCEGFWRWQHLAQRHSKLGS